MKEFIRIVKYTLIAASAGIIEEGTFALFNEVFLWTYWVSRIVSLALSVIWNFTINRKATFRSDAKILPAMLKLIGYYLVFTPLSTWGGNALVGIGWNEYLVEFILLFINFVTEFLFTRFVIYGDKVDNAVKKKEDKTDSADEKE